MQPENKELTIHVDNLSEDVLPFIFTLINGARTFEINENSGLADRCLFYYSQIENLLLLVPRSIDDDFIAYFLSIFPKDYFETLIPSVETGETSTDVLRDKSLLSRLSDIIVSFDSVRIASYSSTAQYYELLEELQKTHSNIHPDESPAKENSWTVDYFGSKAGLRAYRFNSDGTEYLPMCEGETVFGIPSIVKIAAEYFRKYDGVVIKTNKGHAGMGVVILKREDLDPNEEIEEQIASRLTEGYWNIFPTVIEEFVTFDSTVGGGFPNAECYVDQDGNVTYLYSCGMRVTEKGQFKGVEVGTNVLPDDVEKELHVFGDRLGEMFSKAGYVGYFDIDCIYGTNGKLYLSESNVRKTGGTHVYLMARQLFGEDFDKNTYAISNNTYQMGENDIHDFSQLHKKLKPILFDEAKKEGLFIVAANLLDRGVFGYVIFGENREKANEIERQMEFLLQS